MEKKKKIMEESFIQSDTRSYHCSRPLFIKGRESENLSIVKIKIGLIVTCTGFTQKVPPPLRFLFYCCNNRLA